MKSRGVFANLLAASLRQGGGHLVLIDPDRTTPEAALRLARECEEAATDAILFGSSTPLERDPVPIVRAIRAGYGGPVVLFPGSSAQVRDDMDAVLFLALLSGRDARFLIEEQVAAAPRVLASAVEPIPTAYLLVGDETDGSVARVTGTAPLPFEPADAVAAHVQAAACLGFALAYLEAGSGASTRLPASLVRRVAGAAPIPIMVGGGLRSPEEAAELIEAGARFIVTGTIHEQGHAVRPFTDAVHLTTELMAPIRGEA